jgi:tetratricopeptide (TPR) repeat protein
VILAAPFGPARAEEQPSADKRYQSTFEAMMADPTNPERSFEFAEAATAAGDLRGAIAALERILQINPGLANIQLELGVLYLRVGQTDLAASYLRSAMLAPNVPGPVRDRAQTLLLRAERGRQKHFVYGSVYAGGRFDTNANLGPASQFVRVGGRDALLNERASGRNDWSADLAAYLNYTYALESQAQHEIEANFQTYNRRYDQTSQYNVNSVGVDLGPRLYVGGAVDSTFSVRPFVSGSYLALDDASYLRQFGGGVSLRKFFEVVSFYELAIAASDQKYYDSQTYPRNSGRSGAFMDLLGRVSYQVLPATRVFGGVNLARRASEEKFEAFNEAGGWVGVTQVYPPPFGLTSYSWGTTLSVGLRRTVYDEADPAIDPNQKRMDTRLDVILSNNIQMTRTLTLVVAAQYSDNHSSLPNFDYDNFGVSAGVTWNF